MSTTKPYHYAGEAQAFFDSRDEQRAAHTRCRARWGTRLTFPTDITQDRLREWAAEHLMYEVETLVYATVEIAKWDDPDPTNESNVLLDAFAVHARCLNDFLWRDRSSHKPRDAFAVDFCESGVWEAKRNGLPQEALEEIRDSHRFGREVMHLTYDRIDGRGEDKEWPCGAVLEEIAGGLVLFAQTALPDLLDDGDRARLAALQRELEGEDEDKLVGGTGGPLAAYPLAGISGATGMLREATGGTVNVRNVRTGMAGS